MINKQNKLFVTLIIVFSLVCLVSYHVEASLSKSELRKIKEFSEDVAIEKGIGQLIMVGVPGDLLNYSNNKYIKKIIVEYGIGNVFMNSYNYYLSDIDKRSNEEYLRLVNSFHNYLQSLSMRSSLKVPLLVAADFEGINYTSLPYRLIQPPAALTLSTTNDSGFIRKTGQLVGHQLRAIGVQAIMGPVLDLSVTPDVFNTTLQNRSFGSNPNTVYNVSSHYIKGLKEGGVKVFGKHYPGLGDIDENPHKDMPTLTGTIEKLSSYILPYRNLNTKLDGIMTAHVNTAFMEPNQSKPITFSKLFVKNLVRNEGKIKLHNCKVKGLNMRNQVIITDDLSDMGSIVNYMEKNNNDYSQIALKAFGAGHDLLLFSHINVPGQPQRCKNGTFNMDNLLKVKNNLVKHIKSSKKLEKQFRESLRRILILKAKINKNYNRSIDNLFGDNAKEWNTAAYSNFNSIINPEFIIDNKYNNSREFIQKGLESSMIEINRNIIPRLGNLSVDTKVVFYIDEKNIHKFKDIFKDQFNHTKFVSVPRLKDGWFEEQKPIILKDLKKYDRMVYTVLDIDDANLVDHLRLNARKDVRNKLILFLHNSPTLLNYHILHNTTTIGSFTKHPISFNVDVDFLQGFIKPKTINNLTVSLGQNKSFYDFQKDNNFNLKAAKGFDPIKYFATEYEEELYKKNKRLKRSVQSMRDTLKTKENSINKLETKLKYSILYENIIFKMLFYILLILIGIFLVIKIVPHFYNKFFKENKHHVLLNVYLGLGFKKHPLIAVIFILYLFLILPKLINMPIGVFWSTALLWIKELL